VTNVRDFGGFVDLGGIEGLVPASELGYGWRRPQDALAVGQQVEVEVISLEPGPDGRERVTLSMKALLDDPFSSAAQDLAPGTVVAGKVT
jgi:small subunit ribosomal protein S1